MEYQQCKWRIENHLYHDLKVKKNKIKNYPLQEKVKWLNIHTSIGHGNSTWSKVLNLKVLISKSWSINWFTTTAISRGEITSLNHEVGNNTVESASFISKSFFSGCKSSEVLSSFWNSISIKSNYNTSYINLKIT